MVLHIQIFSLNRITWLTKKPAALYHTDVCVCYNTISTRCPDLIFLAHFKITQEEFCKFLWRTLEAWITKIYWRCRIWRMQDEVHYWCLLNFTRSMVRHRSGLPREIMDTSSLVLILCVNATLKPCCIKSAKRLAEKGHEKEKWLIFFKSMNNLRKQIRIF